MSIDGAHDGVRAESAMKMALGGRPEEEPAPSTREERIAEIEAATIPPRDYNSAAEYAAKMILQVVRANPQLDWANISTEGRYEYLDEEGNVAPRSREAYEQTGTFTMVEGGWYDMMRELMDADDKEAWESLGLSGFQWGWAVNTVRWVLDMPPVGNPAIITIGG